MIYIYIYIQVSEWYSCRWDCPAIYECKIKLLGEDNKIIDSFEFHDSIEEEKQNEWHQVYYIYIYIYR